MILAKTITFTYNQHEDRIEFILNYNDFENRVDLSMTRRYLFSFFDFTQEVFLRYAPKETIVAKDDKFQTLAVKTLDIKPQKELRKHEKMVDSSSLLLAQKETKLISKTEFVFKKKEQVLVIKFYHNNEAIAYSVLNMKQFEHIIGALLRVVPFLDWGISPNILDL